MNFEIILVSFSVLLIAWALERLFAKIQSMERHIKGMRSRVNSMERRISKSPPASTSVQQRTTRTQPQTRPASTRPITPTPQQKPTKPTSSNTIVCAFCGTEFDVASDKCPNCNHVNIEKYRVKRVSKSAPSDDDLDI